MRQIIIWLRSRIKDSIILSNQAQLQIIRCNFTMYCVFRGGFLELEKEYGDNYDNNQLVVQNSTFMAKEIKSTVPLIITPHDLAIFTMDIVTCVFIYTWI